MTKQVNREWWLWTADDRDGGPNHGYRGWHVINQFDLAVDYRYRVSMQDLERRSARGEKLPRREIAKAMNIADRDGYGWGGTWCADMVVWNLPTVHGMPRKLTPPMFHVATVVTLPNQYPRKIWLQPELYSMGKDRYGLCFTNKDDHFGDHTIDWNVIDRKRRVGESWGFRIDWTPVFPEIEVAIDAFLATGKPDPRFL